MRERSGVHKIEAFFDAPEANIKRGKLPLKAQDIPAHGIRVFAGAKLSFVQLF